MQIKLPAGSMWLPVNDRSGFARISGAPGCYIEDRYEQV